ncbi:MAG: hypothetical protein BHW64_03205 [Candidatus Melainabacteria bacterium LEY3_CP_29_8]|nr:MAG: hypothetical protein BHW64_03205 [Candidatus Melainabacteria bacterium LEY3_CP_29_8]
MNNYTFYDNYGKSLNYNGCAAVVFWGNPFNPSNSTQSIGTNGLTSNGLEEFLKNSLSNKKIEANKDIISKYEVKANGLNNTIGCLGSLKSKLAELSTSAANLKNLRKTINYTSTPTIKDLENSKISGINSNIGVDMKGKLDSGVYTLKVEGSVNKLTSVGLFGNTTISKSELSDAKIMDFAGYKKPTSDVETVTITNGSKKLDIEINSNTTVSDFVNSINDASFGITAIFDSTTGKISIENAKSDFSITSDNSSDCNAVDVLGLNNLTKKEIISSESLLARPTTFKEVGYTGELKFGGFGQSIKTTGNIDDAQYGTVIEGSFYKENEPTSQYANFQIDEDKATITTNSFDAISSYIATNTSNREINHSLYISNETGIYEAYDFNNVQTVVQLDVNQLNKTLSSFGKIDVAFEDGTITSYTTQRGTTYGELYVGLGLITEEDIANSDGTITIDLTNVSVTSPIFNNGTYIITAQAKEGENAPATLYDDPTVQSTDKLTDLVFNGTKVTEGTFVLEDGDESQTFNVTSETTVEEFNNFLTLNGVSINYDGSYSFNKKTISGTSNLSDVFSHTYIVESKAIIEENETSVEKNLSSYGLSSNSTIQINGKSIELETSDSVADLVNKINAVDAGVAASLNAATGELVLENTDADFAKINIIGEDEAGNEFLRKLGFVIQNESSQYETVEQPVSDVIVSLEKDGILLSTQTITPNEDGVAKFTYTENNEDGTIKGSITFDIKNSGNFIFGVSNTEQNVTTMGNNYTEMLSHTDNLTSNSYTINATKQSVQKTSTQTGGILNENTLLSDLGFGANIEFMIGNKSDITYKESYDGLNIYANGTVGDLVSAINNNENSIVKASIVSGELVLTSKENNIDDVFVIGVNENLDALNALNFTGRLSGYSEKEEYFNVEITDANGNKTSAIVEADENGNFIYNIEQENGEYITVNLKQSGESFINVEGTSSQEISEELANTIDVVNKEINIMNAEKINNFTKAYNAVLEEINNVLKVSDNTISSTDKLAIKELESKLKNSVSGGVNFGIVFGYDSNTNSSILKVDNDKLLNALNDNNSSVTGYLADLSTSLTTTIDLFVKGKFASIYSNSNSKLEEYNNKISSLKNKNDKLMSKLESDYKIIEQMFNQSSNQYSELFAALS